MTTPEVFNVVDYGAVGDGKTDDTAAIQAAIQAAIDASPIDPTGFAGGKLYAPMGKKYRTTGTLRITKPIYAEFLSPILYEPTTGTALVIGSSGWQQDYDLHFKSIKQTSGNSSLPPSINKNGATGVEINAMNFSRCRIDNVQGFTNMGIFLNGHGELSSINVIQHNRFDFGQLVYNGVNIYLISDDATSSSVQANFVHVTNAYEGFFNLIIDNENCGGASDSNYFLFDAMDNANTHGPGGTGQGIEVNGRWNRIDITYLGTNVWFGATSSHNTLNVYNTAATGATYTAGGTNNHYNVVT